MDPYNKISALNTYAHDCQSGTLLIMIKTQISKNKWKDL